MLTLQFLVELNDAADRNVDQVGSLWLWLGVRMISEFDIRRAEVRPVACALC